MNRKNNDKNTNFIMKNNRSLRFTVTVRLILFCFGLNPPARDVTCSRLEK